MLLYVTPCLGTRCGAKGVFRADLSKTLGLDYCLRKDPGLAWAIGSGGLASVYQIKLISVHGGRFASNVQGNVPFSA